MATLFRRISQHLLAGALTALGCGQAPAGGPGSEPAPVQEDEFDRRLRAAMIQPLMPGGAFDAERRYLAITDELDPTIHIAECRSLTHWMTRTTARLAPPGFIVDHSSRGQSDPIPRSPDAIHHCGVYTRTTPGAAYRALRSWAPPEFEPLQILDVVRMCVALRPHLERCRYTIVTHAARWLLAADDKAPFADRNRDDLIDELKGGLLDAMDP